MIIEIKDKKLINTFAKRLCKYLEKDLEWNVYDSNSYDLRECTKCPTITTNIKDNYCRNCGTQLPANTKDGYEDAVKDLEKAIKYMLKGKK